MRQAVDLGYAMKLEPKLAVDYFRSKGYDVSWNWQETSLQTHSQAFTVAKGVRMDVLTTIGAQVDRGLSQGITEQEFKKTLTPQLQELGWWGKQVVVDSAGGAEVVQLGSPARLGTIFRTNLATTYQAGRYQQQLASTETHPYWQYIAILDDNTRTSHRALHGKVFHCTDPIWETMYPPNDWGCRCRVRALTASEVKQKGLKVESSVGRIATDTVEAGVDKRTGEIYEKDVTTYTDGKQTMRTGPGWSGNVGSAAMGSDANIARKLVEMQDRQLRQQVIQSLNNAPARQAAFSRWVGDALTTTRQGRSVQPLGFMADDVAQAVQARTGAPVARLLGVSEQQIRQANALKGVKQLTLTEYQLLPQILNRPQAVLWDAQKQQLLYIGQGNGQVSTVIRTLSGQTPQPGALDAMVEAYKMSVSDLRQALATGRYQLIKGVL
ncbi:phage head morphogenesis protein [Limnobaculum xujianqingii]|uniref:phage head morphogenesis protein n=1 Tax=Limnobaculum xujianqingii TaxID=2738837 RepID=UPI00112CDD22|nr:phage minor head protein [Limnobaculum xujianqingii]